MVERRPQKEGNKRGESILAQEFVETILAAAKENMKEYGSLVPALFLHLESGERVIFSLRLPGTPEEKQAYFTALGLSIRLAGQRIHEALFVSEAWYVEVREEGAAFDVAPSQHPERKEVISIAGRNAQRTRLTFLLQPFSRDSQNQPVFEPLILAQYNAPVDTGYQPVGLIDHLFAKTHDELGTTPSLL